MDYDLCFGIIGGDLDPKTSLAGDNLRGEMEQQIDEGWEPQGGVCFVPNEQGDLRWFKRW